VERGRGVEMGNGTVDCGAREIVISFDTTGSMYPCLTQVRRNVDELIKRLFREVPGIRIGIVAHGDYCDGRRVITTHELSTNQRALCDFVRTVEATGGGDLPECYELVLHTLRSFNWTAGLSRSLVLIGDDVPHPANDRQNTKHLDWRNEAKCLVEMGVSVYSVQALGRRHATGFYHELARIMNGHYVPLHQFANVCELITAVGYQQVSPEELQKYESEVARTGRMNRSLDAIFAALRGREASTSFGDVDLRAVPPGRFQVLGVDDNCVIRQFVTAQGLRFKPGRGFYQLTKRELVQGTKEIILRHRISGDLFTGARARELLGLPLYDEDVWLKKQHLDEYDVFIQSTSYTRKLIGGTQFLYEVDDWVDEE
jgi:hypothetical protein